MAMRWHWPPENSCGKRPVDLVGVEADRASSTSRTRRVALGRVADADDDQRLGDDVADAARAG